MQCFYSVKNRPDAFAKVIICFLHIVIQGVNLICCHFKPVGCSSKDVVCDEVLMYRFSSNLRGFKALSFINRKRLHQLNT
jgi:hypothetical protein